MVIVPLTAADPSLQLVGGKGRALARLTDAKLPVPDGFVISVAAYEAFVAANELQPAIQALLADINAEHLHTREAAAHQVRGLFLKGDMPEDIAQQITAAAAELGHGPGPEDPAAAMAVRSSATAEDLPELSFAGQQDSFLNVQSPAALLVAVRQCWASLWNPRAIDYRRRMQVDQQQVKMAVVVQQMLAAEISGVLFTANPLTGSRRELLVNASFGLGEALVSGQITPDSYLLDRRDLRLLETVIGSKTHSSVAGPGQGTSLQPVPASQRSNASMTSRQLAELGRLCLRVEELFEGEPQDIEWAFADGRCWLLQARPITSLPEIRSHADERWEPPGQTQFLLRRQVVENMPEPLSPLFESLYLDEGLDQAMDAFVDVIRLPFKLDDFVRRPMFVTVNGYGYSRYDIHFSWRMLKAIPGILVWYVTALPKLLKNLTALWQQQGLPEYLAEIERWRSADPEQMSEADLFAGMRSLACADAEHWYYITMMVGAAKISESMLAWLLPARKGAVRWTSGMLLSGFPSTTMQARLQLERIAADVRAQPSLRDRLLAVDAEQIPELLRGDPDAAGIVADLHDYLQRYGHQIYNLDFVEPTQIETPLPVLLSLQSALRGEHRSIESQTLELARQRETDSAALLASVGSLRRWLLGKTLGWAQKFGPFREEALFYMGAAWPVLRRLAHELGTRLVAAGTLTRAEDVYFLSGPELGEVIDALNGNKSVDPELAQVTQQRKQLRETRKRLHPPGRVPQDAQIRLGPFNLTRYFETWETQKLNADDSDVLIGFAVSPGSVTGIASVIETPDDFSSMIVGSILVCPTTTPAWTPLFDRAIGLVTDIGGVLAHGSIVAREYGIPAVLGTGNVTRRVVSGQRITIDGQRGTVTIHPLDPAPVAD